MDQITLVAKDAGAKFLTEFGKIYPLKAAFWLRISGEPWWYLYVTSEQFNDANRRDAYAEVFRAAKGIRDAYVNPLSVKIVNPDDPLVESVVAIQECYPGSFGIDYDGFQLGGIGIDGAYIYPLPVSVP